MKRETAAEKELVDFMLFAQEANATIIPLRMTPTIELAISHELGKGASHEKCEAIYAAIVVIGLAELAETMQ